MELSSCDSLLAPSPVELANAFIAAVVWSYSDWILLSAMVALLSCVWYFSTSCEPSPKYLRASSSVLFRLEILLFCCSSS